MKKNGYYDKDKKHYVAVTNVLKCLSSPALDQWRLNVGCQGVVHNVLVELDRLLVAGDLTKVMEFSRRTDLITSAGEVASAVLQLEFETAVNKGSDIHSMIEDYLKGTTVVVDDSNKTVWNEVKTFIDNLNLRPEGIEKHILSKRGYGGTLDLLTTLTEEQVAFLKPYLYGKQEIQPTRTVVDYKTRNNENGFYQDSGYQVGAYIGAINEEGIECEQGLIININKRTGAIKVKPYSKDPYYNYFLKIFDVWKLHCSPQWYDKEWSL